MYEYVGKTAPFLILAFLALFDGGTCEIHRLMADFTLAPWNSFVFPVISLNMEASHFLCLTALQLLVLQPTKVEPEVSLEGSDPEGGTTPLFS